MKKILIIAILIGRFALADGKDTMHEVNQLLAKLDVKSVSYIMITPLIQDGDPFVPEEKCLTASSIGVLKTYNDSQKLIAAITHSKTLEGNVLTPTELYTVLFFEKKENDSILSKTILIIRRSKDDRVFVEKFSADKKVIYFEFNKEDAKWFCSNLISTKKIGAAYDLEKP